MADTRESLFGPSPQDIAAAQATQQQQDAFNWAKLPAGRGMVAAGAQAGQAFGRVGGSLLGGQDPAQAKAAMLQQAQQDTEMRAQAMGINLATSPQDYYKVAADTLHKYGLVDEAQNVMSIAQNHDLAEREMRVKENTTTGQDRYGMSGNIIYDKRSGSTKPVEGYQGKNTNKDSALAIAKQDYEAGILTKEEYDALKAKLTALPTGTTVNNYPPGPKSFGDKLGELSATEVHTNQVTARDAPIAVNKSQAVIEALDDPNIIVGPGADFRIGLAKALNIAGATNDETIANTQTLISQLADTTLSAIQTSGLGTGQGFTEKDKQMLQDARAGRIPMTKETLRNISIMNIKVQRHAVEKWNNQLSNFDELTKQQMRSVGVPTDPYPLPEIPKAKKYPSNKERSLGGNRPESIPENVWKYMTPEQQKLFE